MAKEQLVMKKDQTKMKKTQEDILSHVEKDGVVPMVFSLMKCVEELSQKVDGLSSQLVTNIIDQASKIKQTIKQKKREAKLPSTSPKRAHDQDPSKVSTRARGVVSQQRGRCRDQATSAASREDDSDQGSKDNSDQGSSDGSAQAAAEATTQDEDGSALEDDHETKRSNAGSSLKAAYKEIKARKDDFEKAEREYKAAKELAMNEKARTHDTWCGEIHLYNIARMAKVADDALVAAREAVKKRERSEFEAAKVDEKDALELKEILVRPVFAMTKDIASTKSKSVNTPLFHAARQVFEKVMPDVIEFYDDE
ncbi:hypothetical protein PF008_g21140 [Phytophthora fragariae]|uniref:Uncharacterized protein n=1 Tax=Phytophthora fragariae TaxID=53985 RepID=A0A6G0QXG6_9STRA|nr:hypothetical protein PF008_g21140 [Phytophthora fragariae]